MPAGIDRLDYFPADRRRRLFAATIPGTVGAIHIVKTRDGGLKTALRPVFLTKHFRHQFFPAVTALRHRRVGIRFLQSPHFRVLLQLSVISTSRGREEIASRTRAVCP